MKIVGKRHVECQVNFADVLDAVSHKKRELFEDCRTVATFSCSIGILPGPKNAAETAALQGRCSPLHATFNSSPSAAPCSLGGLSKRGGHPRVALSSEGFLVVEAREGLHAIGWMSDIWMVLVWAFKVPVTFTFGPVNFFAFSELSR